MFKFLKNLFFLGVAATALFFLWKNTPCIIGWVTGVPMPQDLKDYGPIGDIFGVTNALFAGCASLGLIYTILMQHDIMAETRKTTKEQTRQMQIAGLLAALPVLIDIEMKQFRYLLPAKADTEGFVGATAVRSVLEFLDKKEEHAELRKKYPNGTATVHLDHNDPATWRKLSLLENSEGLSYFGHRAIALLEELDGIHQMLQFADSKSPEPANQAPAEKSTFLGFLDRLQKMVTLLRR